MRFDDRLSTVLRKPVSGDAIARIQYRQLLDLLGTSSTAALHPEVDGAYLRLAELSQRIPAGERAAALREPMVRLRNPRLVSELALGEPQVASAALRAAQLSEEQWLDLVPALPVRARGMIRHRRGLGPRVERLLRQLGINDQALPPGKAKLETLAASDKPLAGEPLPDDSIQEIGAIVRRIEQFRKTRQLEELAHAGEAPRLPLEDEDEAGQGSLRELASFDFLTDADSRIVWSDSAAAAMCVGLRLASPDACNPVAAAPALAVAFRNHQPIVALPLQIAGAPVIAGRWQIDAAPRFDRPGGRFVGYCGRMRRLAEADATPGERPAGDSQGDRMRQILHELRTPVNAIQGFAEVIQQQLFGPTPHEYRALAATIASDSARMLAGFEELERLVKLDAGALALEQGECDLAEVVAATVAQLAPYNDARGTGFSSEDLGKAVRVALARSEAERLAWRLLATLAGASAPGEILKIKFRPPRDGLVRIVLRLPAALAARSDADLFHAVIAGAQQPALAAGMFGTGFALRLAMAEARAAGGMLERRDGKLRLSLPVAAQPSTAADPPLDAAVLHRGNS